MRKASALIVGVLFLCLALFFFTYVAVRMPAGGFGEGIQNSWLVESLNLVLIFGLAFLLAFFYRLATQSRLLYLCVFIGLAIFTMYLALGGVLQVAGACKGKDFMPTVYVVGQTESNNNQNSIGHFFCPFEVRAY